MTRGFPTLALLMLIAQPAAAQRPGQGETAAPAVHVIGLLEVPEVRPADPCGDVAKVSLPLYDRPGAGRPIGSVRVLKGPQKLDESNCGSPPDVRVFLGTVATELLTEAYGYDADGLIVTATQPGWFQIETGAEPALAWIAATPRSVYHPLAELFVESLTYLTEGWDRRLFSSPNGAHRHLPKAPEDDDQDVAVHEVAVVNGMHWARVSFVEWCSGESDETPRGPEGWVRIHADGRPWPTIWFSSKGC